MLLNCGVGEDSWECLGMQGDQTSQSKGNQSWVFIGRTDAEAETPILWPPDVKNWFIGKDPDAGKDWGQEEKGMTEDETDGWHYWLNGHEIEQALGGGDGPESLECCSPWGHRVGHDWTTELNWTLYSCHLPISSASVRAIPFLSFIVPIFAWNVPLVSLIFLKRPLVFPIL